MFPRLLFNILKEINVFTYKNVILKGINVFTYKNKIDM